MKSHGVESEVGEAGVELNVDEDFVVFKRSPGKGGGGGRVIKAHKWRLCVKGEPFSGFRYVKG